MQAWIIATLLTVLVFAVYMAFPALGEWERAIVERLFGRLPEDRL